MYLPVMFLLVISCTPVFEWCHHILIQHIDINCYEGTITGQFILQNMTTSASFSNTSRNQTSTLQAHVFSNLVSELVSLYRPSFVLIANLQTRIHFICVISSMFTCSYLITLTNTRTHAHTHKHTKTCSLPYACLLSQYNSFIM